MRLIDYTSDKGDKLQGALYLPANYQPGKTYPAIVYIYEKLTQGTNNYAVPVVQRIQYLGVHQQRLCGADAGHRV